MIVILMLIQMNLNTGYADADTDLCIRIMSLYCSIIQGDNRSSSFSVVRLSGFVTVDLLNYMSNLSI